MHLTRQSPVNEGRYKNTDGVKNTYGVRVLVTRPERQSETLVLLLEEAGYQPELLPCIGIRPLSLDFSAAGTSERLLLDDYDVVVFTSSNAVESLFGQLSVPLSTGKCDILAVGPATASALENHGLKVSESPQIPYNSEALLKSATLCDRNLQRVLIIKGTGGRNFLQKSLEKQGLKVFTLATYERYLPEIAEPLLERVFLNSPVDIVTITSNDTLNNLALLAGEQYRKLLLRLPLAVSSSRAADLAKEIGFQNTIAVADAPGNLGLVKAISNWKLSRDGI